MCDRVFDHRGYARFNSFGVKFRSDKSPLLFPEFSFARDKSLTENGFELAVDVPFFIVLGIVFENVFYVTGVHEKISTNWKTNAKNIAVLLVKIQVGGRIVFDNGSDLAKDIESRGPRGFDHDA